MSVQRPISTLDFIFNFFKI